MGDGMESNDAASGSARAQELRANLGARRDIESLLAEASATREAAVADADSIIEEAQQVSEQLVRESRTEAERVTTDSRMRAEGVMSRARTEAEDITRQARAAADAVRARAESQVEEHRRRVRAELTEQVTREVTEQSRRELTRLHEGQQAMIGDLEASVRILGVSMEAAVANITEMLGALDSLRTHTAESLGEAGVPITTPPRHVEGAERGKRTSGTGDEGSGDDKEDEPAPSGATSSDDSETPAAAADAEQVDEEAEEPLSATAAFLQSAGLAHHDPPLPPTDDGEVGQRYARDAMRGNGGNGRTTSRRPERQPSEEVARAEAGDEVDTTGKPLGWLFRSS